MGVLEKVEFADWAAPVIPILKDDGKVRICGDHKMTINKASKVDLYPVPRVKDLFTAMSGGVSFSKLDLSHAYLQLQLVESSRQYVTINIESQKKVSNQRKKRVSAITHARRPNNVFELRSFLGVINFYSKFLPNLSSVLSPLYQLIHKSRRWQWRKDQDRAFTEAKLLLKSPRLLTH